MFSFSAIVAKVEGAEKTFMGWVVKEYAQLYKGCPGSPFLLNPVACEGRNIPISSSLVRAL
jgi:hypothetical protein